MQAIKEKLNDMSALRKAKAEAKEEEKAEKELAKARIQVAHEVRMAREAEAAMDLHVNKAAEKVAEHERKYRQQTHGGEDSYNMQESYGRNPANSPVAGYSTDPTFAGGADIGGAMDPYAATSYGDNKGSIDSNACVAGSTYGGSRSGGPPTNNNFI